MSARHEPRSSRGLRPLTLSGGGRFAPPGRSGSRAWSAAFTVSAMNNEALVRRAIEAIWNRGELGVADDLFAHDYVNHDGLIPDLVRGPEAIKISVAFYRIAFPDFYITVEEL